MYMKLVFDKCFKSLFGRS